MRKRLLPAVWTLAASLVRPALGSGDGTFLFPLRIEGVPRPVAMAAGDFNRDRKLDLASVSGGGQATVLLQDPLLRGVWRRQPPVGAGVGPIFLRAADLNADGADDLALADPGSTVWVLISRGDGSFERGTPLAEARGARSVAAADLNGDGRLDLASANHALLQVSIYLGAGDGTFSFRGNLPAPDEPHAIEALDYDGDGRQDLLVGLADAGLFLLRGAGDGSFEPQPPMQSMGCVEYLSTADLNGDGWGDVASTCTDFRDAFVGVSLGNGEFRATLDQAALLSGGLVSPAIADLTGDGAPDLALASTTRTAIDVYPGRGDGGFLARSTFGPIGAATTFLLAADLDRDGRADLVSAENFNSTLTVLWGAARRTVESPRILEGIPPGGAMAIADYDRDGSPDLFSARPGGGIDLYLGPGLPTPGRPSLTLGTVHSFTSLEAVDLNGDGIPDLTGIDGPRQAPVAIFLDPAGGVREVELPPGLDPSELEAGLLNGDSYPDLAAPRAASSQVMVLLGLGGIGFQAVPPVPTIEGPRSIALGDLDRDARADLAVAAATAVVIHRGAGDGSFGAPADLAREPGRLYRDVSIADVTSDGLPDVLIAETAARGLILLRGRTGGGFEEPSTWTLAEAASRIVPADLNGDGLLDLSLSGAASRSVWVLRNGTSGFDPPARYEIGFPTTGHRIADLDLDGALDLTAYAVSKAMVLFGRPREDSGERFRRGDVIPNGRVDITDPIAALRRLFLGGQPLLCPDAADANDDGKLDLSDPVAILSWLFLGGGGLPPPERCGEDSTPDALAYCDSRC